MGILEYDLLFLVKMLEKYNPNHDHLGRFSRAPDAHWIVPAGGGARQMGPKHPLHPDNQMTLQQKVAKKLQEKYPGIAFHFEGVDAAFSERIGEHLHKLLEQFPQVIPHLKYVGTPSGKIPFALTDKGFPPQLANKTYAVARLAAFSGGDYMQSIVLNPESFGNEASFFERQKINIEKDWHPQGTEDPLSIVTHEFGHVVNFEMLYGGKKKMMYGVDKIRKEDSAGEVARMTQYWMDAHFRQGLEVSGYARSKNTDTAFTEQESFAEGFSQMIHAPEKGGAYVKSLKNLLSVMFEGPWGEKASTTSKPNAKTLKKIQEIYQQLHKSLNPPLLPPPLIPLEELTPDTWVEPPYGPAPEE